MIEQLFTIARNTFTESIRQPIYIVLLLLTIGFLAFNLMIAAYTMEEDDKMLFDMSLSTLAVGGLFLAAFTATGVLSREIENKTALTVISKPISRFAFILGKFLGVVGAIAVAYYIWSLTFLFTVRHEVMSTAIDHIDQPVVLFSFLAVFASLLLAMWGNYFYNWVFTSRFTALLAGTMTVAYLLVLLIGKEWNFQPITHEFTKREGILVQLIIAVFLEFQALAIICAIAVACSTRVGQIMTLIICIVIAMLGLCSDYIFGQFTEYGDAVAIAAWVPYAALPNFQYHWLADALSQRREVDMTYVAMVTGYSAFYISAVLCAAVALFQTREAG